MGSDIQEIYNSASPKGFFSGDTKVQSSSAYTITSNYWVDLSTLDSSTNQMVIELDPMSCSPTTGSPSPNDYLTIVIDGNGSCEDFTQNQFLTYKIQEISPDPGTSSTPTFNITLDRAAPTYSMLPNATYYGRVYIYPSGMTVLYDSVTPAPYWEDATSNFESPCDIATRENTPVWNMNIPWSESPAGVFSSTYEDYGEYGSVTYIGTKEYLGYQNPSGQTDTSIVYYYNSFDEIIRVLPQDQKAIAIIHYTNQDIDNVYGEKFATIPFDPQNPTDNTGLARHFKLSIPNLMWHKSTWSTIVQSFYIDPV
jgi:hypothetical protein